MEKLLTIGYEGADLSDFIETLKLAGVTILLDVRELPISRRKGFSKNALREALAVAGIEYRHEKALGSPREVRHQLREDWDYERFFQAFELHLNEQMGLLEELSEVIKGSIALLCFERDHKTCHRTHVADALAELTGVTPFHLGVKGHAERKRIQNLGTHLSKGLSPA